MCPQRREGNDFVSTGDAREDLKRMVSEHPGSRECTTTLSREFLMLYYSVDHYSGEPVIGRLAPYLQGEKVMTTSIREPEHFLPLTELAFQILLALGTGASHGYGIGKEIEERTSGRLNPTTGSLYQALKRLKDDGLIEGAEPIDEGGDARRKYFRLTPLGRRVMALEVGRLAELLSVARERRLAPRGS